MNRRTFLALSTSLVAPSMLPSRKEWARIHGLSQASQLSEAQLTMLLQGWLAGFNADDSTSYRAFIAKYLPDGLPYIDDDLAVRDVSGGFQLLRSEIVAPNQIVGWVKDCSWDRFSKVILTVKDGEHLSDIEFRGASAPTDFSILKSSIRPTT